SRTRGTSPATQPRLLVRARSVPSSQGREKSSPHSSRRHGKPRPTPAARREDRAETPDISMLCETRVVRTLLGLHSLSGVPAIQEPSSSRPTITILPRPSESACAEYPELVTRIPSCPS